MLFRAFVESYNAVLTDLQGSGGDFGIKREGNNKISKNSCLILTITKL